MKNVTKSHFRHIILQKNNATEGIQNGLETMISTAAL